MSLVIHQQKRKNQQVQIRRQVGRGGAPTSARPPPFLANPVSSRRIRFGCIATGGYNITPKAVGNSIGVMCTSSTQAYTIATAFRIKEIMVWGVSQQSGAANTVALTWFGDQTLNFESNREVSDSSTSTAYVPFIRVRPPKRSSAADWQAVGGTFGTGVLFAINLPTGSIIDILLEYVQGDGNASPTSGTVISGGTAGVIRYGPLDGYGGGQLPATQVTSM